MVSEEVLWERLEEGNAAFAAEDFVGASRIYEELAARLRREHDGMAPDVYENLGLAYVFQQRPKAALPCFLRALDGDWGSRRQSLQWLVVCALQEDRLQDGRAWMRVYEEHFGVHPEGWRVADIEAADAQKRSRERRSVVC